MGILNIVTAISGWTESKANVDVVKIRTKWNFRAAQSNSLSYGRWNPMSIGRLKSLALVLMVLK